MPRTVLVASATRAILVLDPSGPPPEGVATQEVVLPDAEAAKLSQPGSYTASVAGVVTVTAPGPETAASIEKTAAVLDLNTQYTTAMTRLTAIVANGPTYTSIQVRDAVTDMAKIVQATLRYLKASV
jgi:hypothetical protein